MNCNCYRVWWERTEYVRPHFYNKYYGHRSDFYPGSELYPLLSNEYNLYRYLTKYHGYYLRP